MRYQPGEEGNWGAMQGSENIQTSTDFLIAADGTKLFLRSWQTAGQNILLILHGLGAHSGWFIDMGNEIARQGITVYAMDHRGYGRSEGLRGHIDKGSSFLEDIKVIISHITKTNPGKKLFVLGHSMGGMFTAHYAATSQGPVSGLLFLNPWVQDTSKVSLLTTLSIFLGGISKSKRYFPTPLGVEAMTTNPEAVQMVEADPYRVRANTASLFFQSFFMRLSMLKMAKLIQLPTLVMQAEEDKSVVPAASRKFFDALGSNDKTMKTYPGYAHDSELETDRSQMDADIVSWIQAHS